MSFASTTSLYEKWLCDRLTIDRGELDHKNVEMRGDVHSFLRGTFYRWAVLWSKHCDDVDNAPVVLGVGDLHVENFGTWRDTDGRLAWGVNDFDEAVKLPYTNDLVRLATSAILAISENRHEKLSPLNPEAICASIEAGYRDGLKKPEPFVLAERHAWLRDLAAAGFTSKDKHGHSRYERFVAQMMSLPAAGTVPPPANRVLRAAFPQPTPKYAVGRRVAGLGSLGRQRFTGIASDWHGGMLVREVKAETVSAWSWARGTDKKAKNRYNRILKAARRSPDPTLRVEDGWVVRRLASDVGKIELQDLPVNSGQELLHAMGRETANVHAPSRAALAAILADLEKRPKHWLVDAASLMRDLTHKDWQELCKSVKSENAGQG